MLDAKTPQLNYPSARRWGGGEEGAATCMDATNKPQRRTQP